MSTASDILPINEIHTPSEKRELIEFVKACYESSTPMFPLGGETSLRFGLAAKRDGVGVSLKGLSRVIDYPVRDMTVTVEAGITMKELSKTLAEEKQRLPIDVPAPDVATLGGVIATNSNGPRRYSQGTVRDQVIGISAVDGTGTPFQGGGRVVKNVAGYDFCKLLTGSMGTLGIIHQVTLRLKPIPERLSVLCCHPSDLDQADKLLAALIQSKTTPAAVELLVGPAWCEVGIAGDADASTLLVAVEGTAAEVEWMEEQLANEWRSLGVAGIHQVTGDEATRFMETLAESPSDEDAPLVLQASIVPSGTTRMIAAFQALDPDCNIQAHAGNGVVIVRMSKFPEEGLARALVANLHPVATALHGNMIVLSNPSGVEMTHQAVWGGIGTPYFVMNRIKKEFDPKNLLNPDRFVYTVSDQ